MQGRNLGGKILNVGLEGRSGLEGIGKEEFKMWIQESKRWSKDHAEIVGSRAKAFE